MSLIERTDEGSRTATVGPVEERAFEVGVDFDVAKSRRFEGRRGLAEMSALGQYSSDRPEEFSAQVARTPLDEVMVEDVTVTSHTFRRSRRDIADSPYPMLAVVVLVEGTARLAATPAPVRIGPGDVLMLNAQFPIAYHAEQNVRMIRTFIGLDHFPARLRLKNPLVVSPLARTGLLSSFVAFARTLTSGPPSGGSTEAVYLAQALARLEAAVLTEAEERERPRDALDDRRSQIERYIELHLTDPELDVGDIASALGISVRYTHRIFNRPDITISRYIREQRINAVSVELRAQPELAASAVLAARHGFGGPDQLVRAFRDRYGMTPRAYHQRAHPRAD